MSYFIYLPAANSSFNFVQDDFYSMIPFQGDAGSTRIYPHQEIYMEPIFGNSQVNFIEMPIQCEQNLHTVSSTEHYSREEVQTKEAKKREKNLHKEIESAKKNSESNLINHFFSYFNSREKSERTVDGCISLLSKVESHKEKLLYLFYNAIHVINARRGRKYVNRKILNALFTPEELLRAVPELKEKIQKISDITVEQLCEVFRKCCFNFFRKLSIDSILTSKRISCVAKEEHFRKRRKITEAFLSRE